MVQALRLPGAPVSGSVDRELRLLWPEMTGGAICIHPMEATGY